MTKFFFLFLTACIFLSICCTKLENPDAITKDEVLQITAIKSTLAANNSDTTHIVARIPKAAGKLDITFTTTRGNFTVSAAKTIKQLTDSVAGEYRFATVLLRSDSTKGDCYITAETGTARTYVSLTFN
ncbi:MAG: hypothetical protein ABIQ88_22225 [Chitinophagaceae bacterium]